jgi:hypothetical protein
VIDAFAAKNIGIRTIDRSSGLLVADPVSAPPWNRDDRDTPSDLADCGRDHVGGFGMHFVPPARGYYNVLVRGDSTKSTVLVTVRWIAAFTNIDCTSSGVWEGQFESAVKARAERR